MPRQILTIAEKIRQYADKIQLKPQKKLTSTALIEKAYVANESQEIMVYGAKGWGKTAYAVKTLSQVYNTWDPQILKNYIIYSPFDFIRVVKGLEGKRMQCMVWDDAGVWLSALKWNDPLLVAITRYLDVCRVHWASIIYTTPFPSHVIKKIRNLPSLITVRIDKINQHWYKPRLGKGYGMWMLPDLKKSRVKPLFEDTFSAIMPNEFYYWYQDYRAKYATRAFSEVEAALYDILANPQKHPTSKGLVTQAEEEKET